MSDRTCEYCGNPLPEDARSDQRFCGRTCKGSARRQRRRRERVRSLLSNFPGVSAPPSQSSASHEADARFAAMIAADEARRAPQTQEREWAAYERRHGTPHPDRVRAQIARGLQARADDWQQGTARFQRTSSSIGEAGRLARSRQRRPSAPVQSSGPHWDDEDPDMLEPAQMIDLEDWRRGRKW